MIVTGAREFLAAYSSLQFAAQGPATARAAFLVAPDGFALAAESARDNRYMAMDAHVDRERAREEHAALAAALRESVPTIVFPGAADTPDAVFPNNVFATTSQRLIVGAMRHPVRQREAARTDIRAFFGGLLGREILDLSTEPVVAELTGSLVIDRARGIGYCGLSERCTAEGARAMHAAFGLRLTFCFPLAADEYHTNVVLAVLASRAAIIATDGFAHAADAEAIAQVYAPHAVYIDVAQKAAFAGNAIALDADRVWMSAGAANSLHAAQRKLLGAASFALRSVPLHEIEKAGGSLRCCVAEIF